MIDLGLLAGALWITAWIGAQPAEVALLYTAGFYASTYAAAQVAPWFVLHLSITKPVLAWMARHMGTDVPVFGTGFARRAISSAQPQWVAVHALDWIAAVFMGVAVWCAFVGVHRFLQAMLDEDEHREEGRLSRIASGLFGASAGVWGMLEAGPALAVLLNLFGHPQSFESNPLLALTLRGIQAVPVFRTMV